MKIKEKIKRLSHNDKVIYYTRFNDIPSISFSFITYMCFISVLSIFMLSTYILYYMMNDVGATLEQIKPIIKMFLGITRIIMILILIDCVISIMDISVHFYKRNKFLKENG